MLNFNISYYIVSQC